MAFAFFLISTQHYGIRLLARSLSQWNNMSMYATDCCFSELATIKLLNTKKTQTYDVRNTDPTFGLG